VLKNKAPYWLDEAVKQLEVPLAVTAPAESGHNLLRKAWDEIYLRLDVINAPGTFNPKKHQKNTSVYYVFTHARIICLRLGIILRGERRRKKTRRNYQVMRGRCVRRDARGGERVGLVVGVRVRP